MAIAGDMACELYELEVPRYEAEHAALWRLYALGALSPGAAALCARRPGETVEFRIANRGKSSGLL